MRKQLLYLTNNRLTAYLWQGGSLSEGRAFANDEAGWLAFSEYLSATAQVPAQMLVDLIEEDFQRDLVPHVLGTARQAILQRRLAQLYRDTPYRQGHYQGREKGGRKDARMLFSALTNAEHPKPWIDALLRHQVPLAGICSVALLSPGIYKKIAPGFAPTLLVTLQSGGLRQSYFHDGKLRFSRLTLLAENDALDVARTFAAETAKIRQFLASTRQLARDELMHIVVVGNTRQLDALRPHCEDSATARHQFVGLDEAARRLGMKRAQGGLFADALYLSLLGRRSSLSHYALPATSRFYRLWQVKKALNAMSVAVLAAAGIWTGVNILNAMNASEQAQRLRHETAADEARLRAAMAGMPPTVASAGDMKSAVSLERMISQNAPAPAELVSVISRALDSRPQIKLDKLKWTVTDPAAMAADASAPPPPAGPAEIALSAALIGVPAKPFQTVFIEGEVVPFRDDYRSALESVRQLAAELESDKRLHAEIVRAPLDVSPAAVLQGQAGKDVQRAEARFALKLLWKP